MVCDYGFRITSVFANWPGSVHDSRIWRESALCTQFESGTYQLNDIFFYNLFTTVALKITYPLKICKENQHYFQVNTMAFSSESPVIHAEGF